VPPRVTLGCTSGIELVHGLVLAYQLSPKVKIQRFTEVGLLVLWDFPGAVH
jgi:hypothetical protein